MEDQVRDAAYFRRSTPKDWGAEAYESWLGIDIKDLGETVLDLGAGEGTSFAKRAREYGVRVVSVNPVFGDKQHRAKINSGGKDSKSIEHKVAAVGDKLPFPDNSFDSVVSFWAVPYYLEKGDVYYTLKEIVRVLKPGGKAILFPLASEHSMQYKNALSNLPVVWEIGLPKGKVKTLFEQLTIKKK